MYHLTLTEKIILGGDSDVEPGDYVLESIAAAQLLMLSGGRGTMHPFETCSVKVKQSPTEHSSRLIMRAGGFGDLELLTPVLRAHKEQRPNCRLAVATMPHYAPMLAGLPYIDEVVRYPTPLAKLYEFDEWVFLENAIEHNPRAKELHMTDVYRELCGIDDFENKLPDYRLKATEAIWAAEQFPRLNGTPRVCIQPKTSARNRNYPNGLMGDIMGEFAVRKGWDVCLLGAKGDVRLQGKIPPNLRDLTGLSFRQSCAVLASADVFIGADSALLHVAGALSVPAVGLYGAFPYKLRTSYCPTTFAFQGTPLGPCCPCQHHVNMARQDHFPADCPTATKGVCGVLESIKPERVVAKAVQIMRTYDPAVAHAL